jgi:hypothetical protein
MELATKDLTPEQALSVFRQFASLREAAIVAEIRRAAGVVLDVQLNTAVEIEDE